MKKNKQKKDEMLPEYDFSKMKGRVRGKYATSFGSGTKLVVLAPDVARIFRDSEAVNEALRRLAKSAKKRRAA